MAAFHRVVVVGDDEAAPYRQSGAHGRSASECGDPDWKYRGRLVALEARNTKSVNSRLVCDEHTEVREEALEGPIHRRDGIGSFACVKADVVERQYPSFVQESRAVRSASPGEQVCRLRAAGEAIVDDEVIPLSGELS